MKNSFDKFLYDSLPPIYRSEDLKIKPNPEPLKRFLQILHEGGFKPLIESVESLRNLSDIDNARPEDLNLIVQSLGLEFPFNMTDSERRKYIKTIPSIYKLKGTEDSFNYLAREIFSTKTSINTRVAEYVEGMTPQEWRRIFIDIEVDGALPDLKGKEENFRKFVEIIRPVNRILVINLMLMYYDEYKLSELARDEHLIDIVKVSGGIDSYLNTILDTVVTEKLKLLDGADIFNFSKLLDSITKTSVKETNQDSVKSVAKSSDTYTKDSMIIPITSDIREKVIVEGTAQTKINLAKPASKITTYNKLSRGFYLVHFEPVKPILNY